MKNVLILEDDEIQNKILEIKLKQNDFNVISCKDYNSAISKLYNFDYTIYFIDINLGNKKNGLDFIFQIRKRSKSLIIVTSNFELTNDLHKEASKLLGYDDYELDPIMEVENITFYIKPLDFDQIFKLLKTTIV